MSALPYSLVFSGKAIEGLRQTPAPQASRIRAALDKLAVDPSRRDIDVAPLRNRPGYRLRVGDHRAIFERDDDARTIEVLRVGPRGSVYKG